MNITYIHADRKHEWNSAEFRCTIPARAIARRREHRVNLGSIWSFAENGRDTHYLCESADVIVLQRSAMPDAQRSLRYWRNRGKVFVADIDDGYMQLEPSHPAYAYWHGKTATDAQGRVVTLPRPLIHDLIDSVRLVGNLTSPSRLILSDYMALIPELRTGHIPNYVDTDIYLRTRPTRRREDDGLIWIGWGGSAGHYQSFERSGVLEALARVISRRPHTRFVFVGSDERIVNALPVKRHQKIHLLWTEPEKWLERLASFDLAFIPAAGDFDARRSLLKPLECSLLGVPWIASRSPAYDEIPADCGVFVENTPEQWKSAIEDMLGARDTARIARAREWALQYDVHANVDYIISIYERLHRESL